MRDLKRILIAGEGGQGVQIISKVLADAAHLSGKKVAYVANYGVEQRGGVSLGYVQISNKEIGFPKFQYADILVILIERAVPRVMGHIKKDTIIIYDKDLVSSSSLKSLSNRKVEIPASRLAKERMTKKVFNMIILGAILDVVGEVSVNNTKKAIEKNLSHKYVKHPELKHFNEKALELGIASAVEREKTYV